MTDIQWPTVASLDKDFALAPRNEARALVYIESDSHGQNVRGTRVLRGGHFYLLYKSDAEWARERFARDGVEAAEEISARKAFDRKLAEHTKKTVGNTTGAERDRLTELAKQSIGTSFEAELHEIAGGKGRRPFGKMLVHRDEVLPPRTPEGDREQAVSAQAQATRDLAEVLRAALSQAKGR